MKKVLKVCLVEDDQADYALFSRYLNNIQNDVTYLLKRCARYEEGLESMINQDHDIYFIDYTLDQKNGFFLVEEAQAKSILHNPFIVLTGSNRPEMYYKFSESGASDYLLKDDLSPSLLDKAITYALERKNVEQTLKKEREFVANIIEEVPYMIIGIAQNKLSFFNPITEEITGYTPQELIENECRDIFKCARINRLYQENLPESFEANIVTKSGSTKLIQWNILDQKPDYNMFYNLDIVLSGKDITAEREALKHRIHKEKMQSLGYLAGGVAHEINNMLQPIYLATDLISIKSQDQEVLAATQKIARNSKAAGMIVSDILLFARNADDVLDAIMFNSVFESALKVADDCLSEDVDLEVIGLINTQNIECRINQKGMIRVLSNLLSNAHDSIGQHGKIRISVDMTSIAGEESLLDGAYVFVRVEDNGSGIEDKIAPYMFDPFFTTKEVGSGTGLGLSIVYNVLQSWSGRIEHDPTYKNGAAFNIIIPVAQ